MTRTDGAGPEALAVGMPAGRLWKRGEEGRRERLGGGKGRQVQRASSRHGEDGEDRPPGRREGRGCEQTQRMPLEHLLCLLVLQNVACSETSCV